MDLERTSNQHQEISLHEAEPPERCIMQPVQSAESNVRFHSSLMNQGQYTVAIATRSIGPLGHPEDTEGTKPVLSFNLRQN